MSDFKILADSNCDLPASMADALELDVFPMPYVMQDKTYPHYLDNRDMDNHAFYEMLRRGGSITTVAANAAEWAGLARPHLEAGLDVLMLLFSSGLSITAQNAKMAAEELREEFPDRKIFVVDSLAASMGEGLFNYLVAKKRQSGATIEETRDYAEEIKLKVCHWFTVDDLFFLKRGGRVSGAAAVFGSMLQIKPVLHVDDEGHLIPVSKVRGRRASLNALVAEMEKTAIDPESQTVFISHGDCEADALYVKKLVEERLHVRDIHISTIGPVIGAHSGPGTVALFFLGTQR